VTKATIKPFALAVVFQWMLLGLVVLLENTNRDWLARWHFLLGTLPPFLGYVFAIYRVALLAEMKWQLLRCLLVALIAVQCVFAGALSLFVILFLLGVPLRG